MTKGFSTMRLDERRAIVTGGASGLGRATAVALAERGANVVVTDIDESGGAHIAEQVGGSFAMLDVGDPTAWERVVATAGPFDIAYLNAGITTKAGFPPTDDPPMTQLTDETYRRIMSINVDGVVYGARAVLPGMVERGRGDIVATASVAGLVAVGADPIYALTKHAVVGFIRSMAASVESGDDTPDVCFSSICPGFTDTNILGDGAREMIHALGVEIMTPDHIAEVVLRSLDERVQGAEWVVWPDVEPHPYEWSRVVPPIDEA